MRAIIQRVSLAKVEINGETHGEIGPGLLVLLGITHDDQSDDIDWLVKKTAQLRIFSDIDGKMNLSVLDTGGDILVISQFTLFGDCKKGNRPGFTRAAQPAIAIPLYNEFLLRLSLVLGKTIPTGEFGADMAVTLVNDGPVTLILDSKQPDF